MQALFLLRMYRASVSLLLPATPKHLSAAVSAVDGRSFAVPDCPPRQPSLHAQQGGAAAMSLWLRDCRAICYDITSSGEFTAWHNGGGLVHRDAEVDHSARVEAGAVVHRHARVGDGAVLHSGAIIGPEVELGSRSRVGYNASLENCFVGHDSVLHSGVRVGQDGFGFFHDDSGNIVKKTQNRRVTIMHGVEIGANSCVDRGSWRDTRIGEDTKIDNMVQIGHNAVIGKRCLICAHCAIGGSAELGDFVIMGGKAAVKDHVTITSKVRIAAKAGVAQSIEVAGDYAGFPAVAARLWRRNAVLHRRQRQPKEE